MFIIQIVHLPDYVNYILHTEQEYNYCIERLNYRKVSSCNWLLLSLMNTHTAEVLYVGFRFQTVQFFCVWNVSRFIFVVISHAKWINHQPFSINWIMTLDRANWKVSNPCNWLRDITFLSSVKIRWHQNLCTEYRYNGKPFVPCCYRPRLPGHFPWCTSLLSSRLY